MTAAVSIMKNQEGQRFAVAGGNYRIIVDGKETNQSFAVIEMTVPPGGGPPPHAHPYMQETFYVVEGEVQFKIQEGHTIVKKGGFINIPLGGAIHCFKNISAGPATLLCTVMPSGLEKVFQTIGAPVKEGEFPPAPAMTEERRRLLQQMDETFRQTTYPPDFLG